MFSSTVVPKVQKQPPEVFYKKGVLRNFTIFTEKHLCRSLFLIKLLANLFILKFVRTPILKNNCERLLLQSSLVVNLMMYTFLP